jgi:hypothetical protein
VPCLTGTIDRTSHILNSNCSRRYPSNSTLMSVDIRTCLNCLTHPSRFMPVSRSQLSRVHTGDSIQNIKRT